MYYLIYRSGADGEILGPADIVDCNDGEAAVVKAKSMLNGQDLGVVQGSRLVKRLRVNG